MKEFLRKRMVYLKAKPQIIPFLLLIGSMVVFTFNMPLHSNAVVMLTRRSAAPMFFVITIASLMSIISFLGYKKNMSAGAIVAIVITVVLLILQLILQVFVIEAYSYETTLESSSSDSPILPESRALILLHMVFLIVTLLSIATLPLYKWAFSKVKTTPKSQLEME